MSSQINNNFSPSPSPKRAKIRDSGFFKEKISHTVEKKRRQGGQ